MECANACAAQSLKKWQSSWMRSAKRHMLETTAHPSAAFLTCLPCPGSCSKGWQAQSSSQVVCVTWRRARVQKTAARFKCITASNSTATLSTTWHKFKEQEWTCRCTRGNAAVKRELGSCPEDSLFLSQGHLRNTFLYTQKRVECDKLQVLLCKLWAILWLNCFLSIIWCAVTQLGQNLKVWSSLQAS